MKNLIAVFALVLACICPAWAQVDASSPEGQALGAISQEKDAAKKQALLEEFVKKFPSSSQSAWAWEQLQDDYLEAKDFDKALEAGEKALATDPDNPIPAYNNLKAAEGKGDVDLTLKWSAETSRIARKVVASAKPGDDADTKARADYAQQLDTYSDYALLAAALKTTDPKQIILLAETLQQRSPKSEYLGKLTGRYLAALQQAGQNDKVGAAAEKILQGDPNNPDALLAAANFNMEHQNLDKSLAQSTKLVEVLQASKKPDETTVADWQKKKDALLAVAYWIQGLDYYTKKDYQQADKVLRQALPLVQDNKQLLGSVTFHLGVSDYELAKAGNKALMKDALTYLQQSASLPGPLQAQAEEDVKTVKRAMGPAKK
jgi:tetratricopeptide (TPR) repeat protein